MPIIYYLIGAITYNAVFHYMINFLPIKSMKLIKSVTLYKRDVIIMNLATAY